jgi:DnaJ family protein C protein 27
MEKPKKINYKQPKEFLRIKICLLGEGGVGKSALCSKYCDDRFEPNYVPTVAVDYKNKVVEYKDYNMNLNFWDFSGHPEFFEVRNEFYKDCNIVCFLFDLTLRRSLEGLDYWYKEIIDQGIKDVPMFMIGNKKDLLKNRVVGELEALNWSKSHNAKYFEISAYNGYGLDELFNDILKTTLDGI